MCDISILVPCYNTAVYLSQCMDSLLGQTHSSLEFICVNDGSTDNTLSLLYDYARKDGRIVVIDQPNGGYGKAMNVASKHAKGKYIGIVEPDDYVSLDMFKILFETAENNDLDFVKADFYRFATNGKSGGVDFFYNALSKNCEDYNVVFNPREKVESFKFIMNTWCGIYKRNFLEQYNIVYNETPGASFQDNGFYFQTFTYASRAMIIDKPLYFNRRDNPNSSVKNPEKVYALNAEYDWIRKRLENDKDSWERGKEFYWLCRFNNCIFTLNRIDKSYHREYISRIHCEFSEAKDNGELNWGLFTTFQQELISLLMNDCILFYDKYMMMVVSDPAFGYRRTGNVLLRKIHNFHIMLSKFGFSVCAGYMVRKLRILQKNSKLK